MSFGEKLRICRVARNLTQPDLAALVGSTKQVISNYENGLRVPKVVAAAKLASVLDVPVNYLVNDCVDMRLWESEDYLEDYWLASPSERMKIVTRRGIDPRIASDYEKVSTIACFVKEDTAATGNLSSDESKLVDTYRSVTEQGQQEMMAHADYIGERYKKNPSASADKAM